MNQPNFKYCPKIAGVVVLYNPDNLVYENIMTYAPYLDTIYLLDNSTQNNSSIVDKLKTIPRTVYIHHPENYGIAKSLNEALSLVDGKYNWLLTMDQDTKFEVDSFKQYMYDLNKLPVQDKDKIYGITPRYEDKGDSDGVFQRVNSCITSGNIVNVKIAIKCGGYDEALFIDSVDEEFCYRCNGYGYHLYEYTPQIMIQKIGNPHTIKIFGKNVCTPTNHNYIRLYYITRNGLYVAKKYPYTKKYYYSLIVKRLIKVILFESDKFRKVAYIIKGLRDYCHNKTGKMS